MGTVERSSSIPAANGSELPEVMALLEGYVLLAESLGLRTLDGEEGAGEERPQRFLQHRVALEAVEGGRQRRGEALDAPGCALGVGIIPGIDHDRLRRLEGAANAVESCGEQPTECQIRIGGGIARLELGVGGARPIRREGRGD